MIDDPTEGKLINATQKEAWNSKSGGKTWEETRISTYQRTYEYFEESTLQWFFNFRVNNSSIF